jgi:hypothetical protein
VTRATSESESPGGAHGEPAGGTGLLRSVDVKAATTGLDGTDGSVSVSYVLLRLVNSRTICYVRIWRSEVR